MHHLLACVAVGLFLGADTPKDDVEGQRETPRYLEGCLVRTARGTR
jgi:hypothetical protein